MAFGKDKIHFLNTPTPLQRLDAIFDCHVYLADAKDGEDQAELLDRTVKEVTEEWEARGEKVYYIPMGSRSIS